MFIAFQSERREAENKVEDSVEVSKEKEKRKAEADKSTKRVDNSFKKHLDVHTEVRVQVLNDHKSRRQGLSHNLRLSTPIEDFYKYE